MPQPPETDIRIEALDLMKSLVGLLDEKWVTMTDIKNTLKYGDVDFDKSNIKYESGKIYIVEGKTTSNVQITLEFINYPDKVVLKDIIKK